MATAGSGEVTADVGHRIAGFQHAGAEVFGVCAAERVGFNGNNIGAPMATAIWMSASPTGPHPVDQNVLACDAGAGPLNGMHCHTC